MTLWRNESEDTVKVEFDLGKGHRELITLCPGAEIELPSKLDRIVPMEAPQLKVIESRTTEIVAQAKQVFVFPDEPVKKKSGRKSKDKE